MDFFFFQPSKSIQPSAQTPMTVFGGALTELVVRRGQAVSLGLWGNGYNGDPLEVRAYRGGTPASGSASSPIRLSRTANDPHNRVQQFLVTGLQEGDMLVGVSASGRARTAPLPVYELRNTPSALMREAAQNDEYRHTLFRGLCPKAIPYLALRDSKMGGMLALNDLTIQPLMNVHGLAVHTTAGTEARSPFTMARWGCVAPWNTRNVNAHFAVAGDGALVQFIPTTFVAYAQYSPGNEHWISVEVDNDGKTAMNDRQLNAVRLLFQWIANTYGVPQQVATGCLFPKRPVFDRVTEEVCDRGDVPVTTDPYAACMSRGVSCHWWLEANKNNNSHVCPGAGILNQLDAVAQG